MTSDKGFQGKQFQAASMRHHGKAPEFSWEHWPLDAEEPEIVVMRVDPLTDVIRLGAAFGGFAQNLRSIGQLETGGDVNMEEIEQKLEVQLPRVRNAVRACILPPDRSKWDLVADTITTGTLSQIVRWIMGELSGVDPTQPAPSSTGSAPTGNGSTDGAQPEELTPPASPSPAA